MKFTSETASEAGKKSKRRPFIMYFRKRIETEAETVYNELRELARGGNIGAWRLILEYGIGKPRQSIEVETTRSPGKVAIEFVEADYKRAREAMLLKDDV